MAAKKKTSTKKPAAKPAAKKSSTTKTTAKKPGATKPKPVSKKSRASEQMDQSMDLPKKSRGDAPMKVLADPMLWELVRKLAAHKKLRDDVTKLAAGYPDPKDEA